MGVSTAAVLAVAGTALLVVSDRTDGGPGQVAGPASPTAEAPVSPATPGLPKSRPTLSVPSGMTPVLPPLLLHSLLPLLPAGVARTQITGADNTDMTTANVYSAGATVSLVLEDSTGPSLISVSVQQTAERADDVGCLHSQGSTNAECLDYRTPDGSRMVERRDWVYPAAPDTPENRADGKAGPSGRGPKEWSVRIVRHDGVVITVDEIASREEKGDIGRDTPLLSMDWLRSIALAPVWQVWVSADANKMAANTPPAIKYQSPFHQQKNEIPPPTTAPSTAIPGGAWSENGTGFIPPSGVPTRSIPESRSGS
ncbi:hypothetical protein [Embleya sp. NPDC005575]|uniref:hypothetical protein n=1 Tax=Embleya sp. NPDC005575 TaxID=3156892 RepID=UPI0033B33619